MCFRNQYLRVLITQHCFISGADINLLLNNSTKFINIDLHRGLDMSSSLSIRRLKLGRFSPYGSASTLCSVLAQVRRILCITQASNSNLKMAKLKAETCSYSKYVCNVIHHFHRLPIKLLCYTQNKLLSNLINEHNGDAEPYDHMITVVRLEKHGSFRSIFLAFVQLPGLHKVICRY